MEFDLALQKAKDFVLPEKESDKIERNSFGVEVK